MASSISSYLGMRRSTPRRNLRMRLRARDQSSAADEGKSSISVVDANMGVLKERIEMLRMAKKSERCSVGRGEGWSYVSGYDGKLIKSGDKFVAEAFDVAELAVGTAGLTVLGCTVLLCFFSLVVHLG